ncbi:MAG: P-II family nitrogen regulator [Actinomycetota bacterium]|nr:P-II family nitrogen regulator [Actinomycetota bacterium]MCL6092565.1 P-II family nitrogen regulator [Actinomycetota bacterium]MDA8166857.1 P-II family nitrogen regulator [Actinomycetota bacterium]
MKEITAIIRPNKIQRIKDALAAAGYPSITVKEVLGRGKQRGLQHEFCHELPRPGEDTDFAPVSFIPKRMLTLVVADSEVAQLVELIINVNQTGNVGDGKIIISPVGGALRIRTGESGESALM